MSTFSELNQYRDNYDHDELIESSMPKTPFPQFENWFATHLSHESVDPNVVFIATTNQHNHPSMRACLIKHFDENGFVFFTNYNSRKAQEIENNPHVSLLFYFPEKSREIRIEGICKKTSPSFSDDYFNTRSRDSQISAWASHQSTSIQSKEDLHKEVKRIETKFKDKPLYRPDFWGGYVVTPNYYEFWQGQPNRLHDRIAYTKKDDSTWNLSRLCP